MIEGTFARRTGRERVAGEAQPEDVTVPEYLRLEKSRWSRPSMSGQYYDGLDAPRVRGLAAAARAEGLTPIGHVPFGLVVETAGGSRCSISWERRVPRRSRAITSCIA